MPAATDEDRAFLAARGFVIVKDSFTRTGQPGSIIPVYVDPNDHTRSGQHVMWRAVKGMLSIGQLHPTPTAAFVEAEIEGWVRPVVN